MQRIALVAVLICLPLIAYGQPVSDSDFIWIEPHTTVVLPNAGDAKFHVAVMIDNSTELGAISLPLRFTGHSELRIDTTVITRGEHGLSLGPAGNDPRWTFATSYIDPVNQGILIGFATFTEFPPHHDTLCYVHFDLDSSVVDAVVTLDTSVVNAQRLRFTTTHASELVPTWSAGIIDIRIGGAGDLNCDGTRDLTDVVFLGNVLDGLVSLSDTCGVSMGDLDGDGDIDENDYDALYGRIAGIMNPQVSRNRGSRVRSRDD